MKIRLIGQANHTGIGQHFAAFCHALIKSRPALAIEIIDGFDERACMQAVLQSRPTDINICFIGTDMRRLQGRNIQWVPFESTRLPDMLMRPLLDCHEIWTMTQWGQSVLIDNGLPPGKITVMPQGIDGSFWQPRNRVRVGSKRQYLMVGKYEQRKSISETLQAWAHTLRDDTNSTLVLKTHATMHLGEQGYHHLRQEIQDLGIENFSLIWGIMDDQQMLDLYQEADAFILPTKAEGWGRPLMEAAAMGLPIITTNHSAHGEWLADISDSVIWVDHDLVELDDENFRGAYGEQESWGLWAQPRQASLVQALDRVATNLPDLQTRAQENSQIIREKYSWSRVVDQALDALRLGRKP